MLRSTRQDGMCGAAKIAMCAFLLGVSGCERQPSLPASPVAREVNAATVEPVPQPSVAAAGTASANASAVSTPAEGFATTGPLVVDQQADILAERDGRLLEVRVDIGDQVRQGQLLVVFDDRELRATRAAKAARTQSLKALVEEGEAEQQGDEADLRRAEYMLKEKIISEEDYEHTKFKLTKAVAEVASFKADEAASEFDLHAIDVQLEQSRVVAPFSGVIGRRNVRPAQEVKKGDPLLWLTAESPLHILFTVPESAMQQFHVGAALELTSPLYPEIHQAAVVRRVSPVVDPASGSVEVVGDLTRASKLLKPGMSMQIRLGRS